MDLRNFIRAIPDYPVKGVIFRDITTLLKNPLAYREGVDQMRELVKDLEVDSVIGVEARGFIVGAPLAYCLNRGFIPVRKPGKLPYEIVSQSYALEYGTDSVEMHADAVHPKERVLIVDDLLATGGTATAVAKMVEELGGVVAGFCFLIELDDLGGRKVLGDYDVFSVIHY